MSDGNSLTRTSRAAPSANLKGESFSPKLRALASGLLLASVVLPKLAPVALGIQFVADASDAVLSAAA